jgi:cell wall-associated NlpC family hydrolase
VGGLIWTGQPSAQAVTLSDAQAQLSDLQGQASAADEQYNQIQASLDAAQAKLTQTQQDITDQQAKVDVLRDQVATVTLQQFQDHGITSTAALLVASNQQDVLDRILVSSMVADTTAALLQNYELGQAALADLQASEQATVASIQADQAQQLSLKNQADQKATQAQQLVNNLTAQQQAALAAAQARPSTGGNTSTTSAGKSAAAYTPPPPVQNGAAAAAIVAWAMARVGYPYVYGGAGPKAYDCSGFTMAAYASVGIKLPHGASYQYRYGVPVSRQDLQPGDLVFFYSGPSHVGIYVGGGMIVDARNSRLGVVYRSLDDAMPITGARRIL